MAADDPRENFASGSGDVDRVREWRQRFEEAWSAGVTPELEAYLDDVPLEDRDELFGQLLAIELRHREAREEITAQQEYLDRFPQFARLVQHAFGNDEPAEALEHAEVHDIDEGLELEVTCPDGHIFRVGGGHLDEVECPICGATVDVTQVELDHELLESGNQMETEEELSAASLDEYESVGDEGHGQEGHRQELVETPEDELPLESPDHGDYQDSPYEQAESDAAESLITNEADGSDGLNSVYSERAPLAGRMWDWCGEHRFVVGVVLAVPVAVLIGVGANWYIQNRPASTTIRPPTAGEQPLAAAREDDTRTEPTPIDRPAAAVRSEGLGEQQSLQQPDLAAEGSPGDLGLGLAEGVGDRYGHGIDGLPTDSPFTDSPSTNQAVQTLLKLGALVEYDRDNHVTMIHLGGTNVTDADLALVAGFPEVERLYLDNTAVTDAGLAHLSKLRSLARLSLEGTQVTDAGVQKVQAAVPGLAVEGLAQHGP